MHATSFERTAASSCTCPVRGRLNRLGSRSPRTIEGASLGKLKVLMRRCGHCDARVRHPLTCVLPPDPRPPPTPMKPDGWAGSELGGKRDQLLRANPQTAGHEGQQTDKASSCARLIMTSRKEEAPHPPLKDKLTPCGRSKLELARLSAARGAALPSTLLERWRLRIQWLLVRGGQYCGCSDATETLGRQLDRSDHADRDRAPAVLGWRATCQHLF